jgi:xanthine dehydrogenase accessory factor
VTAWIESLRSLGNEPAMLVTVMNVRGSAPRECGAKMLVTASEVIGTIGGGQLEFQCTRMAVERIAAARMASSCSGSTGAFLHRFPLGANCGQCCGGVVEVLFERVDQETSWTRDLLDCHEQRRPAVIVTEAPVDGSCGKHLVTAERCRTYGPSAFGTCEIAAPARRLLAEGGPSRQVEVNTPEERKVSVLLEPFGAPGMSIALFGAGHTGSAVVAAMAGLDCEIRWIDSRRRVFPASAPGNVVMVETGDPAREVAVMPPGAYYLVMTHSHPLDYEICERVLRRGDFAYLGLIGSRSKRRRFEQRMNKVGMAAGMLERLTCPIGIPGVGGKRPAEIAVAVAAELLKIKASMSAVNDGFTGNNGNVHVLHRLKGEG